MNQDGDQTIILPKISIKKNQWRGRMGKGIFVRLFRKPSAENEGELFIL
jgi:hypothetical protein